MRIHIQPKTGLLEDAVYFSCDNARVVNRNIVCTIAFWAASGAKMAERDELLTDEQYAEWCDTGPESDDLSFFTQAHVERLGLVVVPPPPPVPPPPYVPPTPEEIEAQRQEQINELTQRIAGLQAQLAIL